ncbi:MAG: ATP-binding cassette domain-containing protein [Gordonia sp. (in: high G+C Gram-positive bacteria)]
MGKGFQGALMRAFGAKDHFAKVTAVERISPHMIRVDFTSDGLLYSDGEKPSAWVRCWFDFGGSGKLYQRGYTLVDPDPATGNFGVDFLVHEPAGPASLWAASAEPGDEIVVQRLGGDGWDVSGPQPDGYLLVGDMAAWPAFVSILEAIDPGVPARVFLEYTHDDDRDLPLPERDTVEVTWVPSRDDSRALVDAIGDHDYRGWHSFVAAESTATRLVKSVLQNEHGHNKATMHSQAYWIRGRSMGKAIETAELTTPDGQAIDVAALAASPAELVEASGTATPLDPSTSSGSGKAGSGSGATKPPRTAAERKKAAKQAAKDEAAKKKADSILAPARPVLILGGVIAFLLAALQVVPLILFAELARRFVDGADRHELVDVGVTGVAVLLIGALLSALLLTGLHFYDQVYAAALRRRVLEKITRLPLGWFQGRRSAEVKKLAQDDITSLHYLVTHAVPDLVAAVVTPLAILIYLFTVYWGLALVLLIPVVVYVVLMVRLAAGDKPRLQQMLRWNATLPGEAERYIAGQPVSRVFGDGATVDLPGEVSALGRFLKQWQHDTIDTKAFLIQLNRPMTSMVVVAVAGTAFITGGAMPAAAILPFLVLGTSFGDRLLAVSYAANGLREGMGAKSGLELLLTTPELASAQAGAEPAAAREDRPAALRFENVSFGYLPGRTVLDDFTLDLPAGGTTAVVGPSGAGKSTVAALAARLWDPESGSVTLDGVDLRDIDETTFRSQVSTVLQDVQLVRGTVHDNIALGIDGATREQVADAARTAYIADVIEALPQGYDTVVDRDSLSGGQRQRIAIARALLGDPRVVVLDEATAAADPDSEWEVRQGLSRLLQGRTVVVVAHRLHTVADADLIVVLDDGRIAEQGTREELLAHGGLFAAMNDRAQEALR